MRKLILLLLLIYVTGISCQRDCKELIITWHTCDTIYVTSDTTELCDSDLEMMEGTPSDYFNVANNHADSIYCLRSWRYK